MPDMPKQVYLDIAAATPLDERVFNAMEPYLKGDQFYNPSSPYLAAKQVKTAVLEAKEVIGKAIGAKASELVMTAGATESINIAIWGVLSAYDNGHAVTTAIEHQAVLEAMKRHDHTVVRTLPTGLVEAKEIKKTIKDTTVLVSVGYVNSELGTVQPLRDIAAIIREVRQSRLEAGNTTPLYLHSDASQATGYFDLHVSRLGVDLLTLNAGKCYGPKQTGLLWVKPGVDIRPLIVGGGQERNLRSGTESPANIIGFAKAIELAEDGRKKASEAVRALRDDLQHKITSQLPNTIVGGHPKRRAPNHLHLAWEGIDAERVLFALDNRGIMVATGSACAANKGTRSHVLSAVGMKPAVADGSIRITLGKDISKSDVQYAARNIVEVVNKELAV